MSDWFRPGRGLALGVMIGALTIGTALPHLINALGGLESRATLLSASPMTFVGGVTAARGCTAGPYTRHRWQHSTQRNFERSPATANSVLPARATADTYGSFTRCGPSESDRAAPSNRSPKQPHSSAHSSKAPYRY